MTKEIEVSFLLLQNTSMGEMKMLDILGPQVPVDTLNGLLGDKEALRKVLLRHVVPGR